MNPKSVSLVPVERIESRILLLRGQRVMLDSDLSPLYGVPTKALNQAVRRNRHRFPRDFMFQLTREESHRLSRSQFVTLNRGQNRKYLPHAFTEHGVAMLSSVLRSETAVRVNIAIVRAFVRLRKTLAEHADLVRRIGELEQRYEGNFRILFAAMRRLMASDARRRRGVRIGFHAPEQAPSRPHGRTTLGARHRMLTPRRR